LVQDMSSEEVCWMWAKTIDNCKKNSTNDPPKRVQLITNGHQIDTFESARWPITCTCR
jgi:hypothetical protein